MSRGNLIERQQKILGLGDIITNIIQCFLHMDVDIKSKIVHMSLFLEKRQSSISMHIVSSSLLAMRNSRLPFGS